MLMRSEQQARFDSGFVRGLAKKIIIAYGLLLFLGCALLSLVYCLPVENMRHSAEETLLILEEEGLYPSLSQQRYDQVDNFADAIAIKLAINPGESGLIGALASEHKTLPAEENATGSLAPIDDLRAIVQSEDSALSEMRTSSYARYWHGYLIFLKPLLFFGFSLNAIRMMHGVLTFVLLLAIGICAIRKHVGAILIPLLAALVGFSYYTAFFCLEFFSVLTLSLVATLLVVWQPAWLKRADNVAVFFFILGALTSYFDFLTAPIIVFGIPLCSYLFCSWSIDGVDSLKAAIWRIFFLGILWFIGYVSFWASKWIIASLILQRDVWADALQKVEYRSSHSVEIGEAPFSNRVLFAQVVSHFRKIFLLSIVVGYVCVLALLILFSCKRDYMEWRTFARVTLFWAIAYGIIALLPVLWVFATANHSFNHHWFTFRNFTVSYYAVLLWFSRLIVILNGFRSRKRDKVEEEAPRNLRVGAARRGDADYV